MSRELALLLVAVIAVAGLIALWISIHPDDVADRARLLPDGTQEMHVVVDRGYAPSHIELEAGVPTVLRFERRNEDACTEMLVSELWPTAHRLAPRAETCVRFTPERPGRYAFTCGMGMYSGELIVHAAAVA